jgi:1,4-alpha-glucan branching enzyme
VHTIDERRARFRIALPHAESARLSDGTQLERIPGTFVFECTGTHALLKTPVCVSWIDADGQQFRSWDCYSFGPIHDGAEIAEFAAGRHTRAQRLLGCHAAEVAGCAGYIFSVWAPNAERVSVVGDFNRWDGRAHAMRVRESGGIWELFIPGIEANQIYKFEIRNRDTGEIHIKTDPYGRLFELRPATASVTCAPSTYRWSDQQWIAQRSRRNWRNEPISVYEMHLGSWQRDLNGDFLNYREIAQRLVTWLRELNFTHVEIMPATEHPFDDSWGYQTTGFFAPTRRFGTPDDFRAFVDTLHASGFGVILDWVPGHFPKDQHALAAFDGSRLYEYEDPRKAEHPDWQTLVFNYARNEVQCFLLSSALYWLEEFHVDGLRVDAVASMLYLDYSRDDDQWEPNLYGGNENLEAIAFIKRLNELTHRECSGTFTVAEESTAWPKVSHPTFDGGLGFSFKWNMGWMHDTLEYMKKEPVHRSYHHDLLTFGPMYAFTENFLLPLSHDEVVHGKRSLLGRMPGDHWQRFANLRLLLTFQWLYPGKKLLFMGCEFGQPDEWNHHTTLPWHLLENPSHAGLTRLVHDLNLLYRERDALQQDSDGNGFYWLSWEDRENSVLTFARRCNDEHLFVLLNCTPVPRDNYLIGVPFEGRYKELLNSDSEYYGGSNFGNVGELQSTPTAHMGQPNSLRLRIPPLAAIVLERV